MRSLGPASHFVDAAVVFSNYAAILVRSLPVWLSSLSAWSIRPSVRLAKRKRCCNFVAPRYNKTGLAQHFIQQHYPRGRLAVTAAKATVDDDQP
jgi:hypothetical protein